MNTSITNSQFNPEIAVFSDDEFVVTWQSSHSGSYDVVGQRFGQDGVKVGNEFTIS